MSRIIKLIDNETIEIADYRNPEVIFKSSQNPPTLQNTRDEIEHLEWYCTFKDTINPFQIYEENHRLHSIIKEVRDNLENSIKSINEKLKNNKEPFEVIDGRIQYINDYRVVRLKAFRTKCKELLEILDKENI